MNQMNNMNMHMGSMGPGMPMPANMMQQQSPQMGQGMPQGMPQQMQQGMQQPISQMAQQMAQGMMPQMPQGMPQQMPQGMPQQMQQGMPQQQQPHEKIDNVSKVKSLMGPLRESLTATIKSAALVLKQNYNVDSGQKGSENPIPRFDKNLEEFYSLCDQMELHLTTAMLCIQQAQSAGHYLPLTVMPSRMDPPTPTQDGNILSYPQYLSTVRSQVSYAKEIHDTLVAATQNISPTE